MAEYLQAIVPAVVSIIGFFVTYHFMKKQFLYSVQTSMYESRKKIYIETYKLIMRTLDNKEIVFESNYEKKIKEAWMEISIFSESEVYNSFNKFNDYIKNKRKGYNSFCRENDWEKYDIDEMGNKTPTFTQLDIDRFNYLEEDYKEKNQPKDEELKGLIDPILKSMRKELNVNE